MGAIIGKFRKAKTTTEQLERLEEKISEIEKYTINTQEQKKRFVGNFLAISIGVYVIAFIVFYFVYFPPTWNERILYSVPLFLFPIVIYLLRRLLTWYFQRKLNKNSKRLNELRSEKKKILEKVMEKETYKVAVSLLARFGDKSYGTRPSLGMSAVRPSAASTGNQAQSTALQGNSSRQSMNSSFRGAMNTSTSSNSLALRNTTALRGSPAPSGGATSTAPVTPRLNSQSLNYAPRQLTTGQQGAPQHGQVQVTQELRRRTPFPVLDLQNKGVFDRIVDVLMGDGPQDRFAMICKECYAHNGMALKDDFDFMAFRCAFCNVLNPARKARQVAPLLPKPEVSLSSASITRKANGDTSSSSDTSSDTSGDENDDVRGGSNKRLNFTECDDTSSLAPRAVAAVAASASASAGGESGNEELTNLIDAMEIDAEQSNEDFEEQAYTNLDEEQTQQQEEEELLQQQAQSKAETPSVSAKEGSEGDAV